MPKFVFLWTDIALWLMVLGALAYAWHVRRSPNLRATWARVARDTPAMCSAVVLAAFALVGLLDSVHYRPQLPPAPGAAADAAPVYAPAVKSALDGLLGGSVLTQPEKTYSSPLAVRQFTKETLLVDDKPVRDFPRLRAAGTHLADPDRDHLGDVSYRLGLGLAAGLAVSLVGAGLLFACLARRGGASAAAEALLGGRAEVPWRAMAITFTLLCLVAGALAGLSSGYHALGTDRIGNDVLWQALKSIRTALVIGSLTTLAMLPPAIIFGIAAGYFKGRVDDAIQYLYTTITSIPGVLLVAACALMMQVYIDNHADLFDTSAARADLRLFLLCMILGFTGWAGLCRLLRAETLKLRELEYVQAARAFGVSHWRIMTRHLLPNVAHLVLITVVLEFSGLVLYEAVLSYLGIGVDPSMNSFGSMIDGARLEMSRDPMIWWNLMTAFLFMLALVLAANLFADAVRDAFDPRTRRYKPGRVPGMGWFGRRPGAALAADARAAKPGDTP
ncbi:MULTISPECIES: ABC transporter permease [Achromobacter]|uniref:ABC transmembrane type-1 domain-containing protein n=2 Tax=Achromobacter TaxID=222 RepID=A0ABM8LXA4_9BURK|nr:MULTISPECIES: ABC transporter permease [Achromobacter]AKP89686.1 putative oligopeptide transport integral membrane protein [Achromobacter xylosoxidans]MBQ2646948.1 ABC transporter permease [Achromobacter sp.]AOU92539.1 oligopeptide transport system permease [Achromobacter ruhlandii]MCZ8430943.1 ABC transporter permease [Achromobacter ruhlandii]MDC6087706.1 ABC transporter permease [Achromobacter ruhlandii]